MNKIKTFFVICENFWKHQYRCKVPLDSAPINHDKWFYLAVSVPICLSVLHPFCLLPLPLQPGSRREWPPVHQLSGKTSLYGVGLLSSLRPMSWARKLTRFPRSRAPGFLSHSCIVYLSPTCLVFLTTCSLFFFDAACESSNAYECQRIAFSCVLQANYGTKMAKKTRFV